MSKNIKDLNFILDNGKDLYEHFVITLIYDEFLDTLIVEDKNKYKIILNNPPPSKIKIFDKMRIKSKNYFNQLSSNFQINDIKNLSKENKNEFLKLLELKINKHQENYIKVLKSNSKEKVDNFEKDIMIKVENFSSFYKTNDSKNISIDFITDTLSTIYYAFLINSEVYFKYLHFLKNYENKLGKTLILN